MTYTKKQFLEDVKKEAVALKKHATPEELANLDFINLRPDDIYLCIYGQMTGHCDSDRATELIQKSASILFDGEIDAPVDVKDFKSYYFSPIEFYIIGDKAKNKNLIDFLKGNRKDLVL